MIVLEKMIKSANPDHCIRIRVFKPVRNKSGNRDWRCLFTIKGLGKTIRKYAPGVDSLQSLYLAICGIQKHLGGIIELDKADDDGKINFFIAGYFGEEKAVVMKHINKTVK